jgi:hypothetical protein
MEIKRRIIWDEAAQNELVDALNGLARDQFKVLKW